MMRLLRIFSRYIQWATTLRITSFKLHNISKVIYMVLKRCWWGILHVIDSGCIELAKLFEWHEVLLHHGKKRSKAPYLCVALIDRKLHLRAFLYKAVWTEIHYFSLSMSVHYKCPFLSNLVLLSKSVKVGINS